MILYEALYLAASSHTLWRIAKYTVAKFAWRPPWRSGDIASGGPPLVALDLFNTMAVDSSGPRGSRFGCDSRAAVLAWLGVAGFWKYKQLYMEGLEANHGQTHQRDLHFLLSMCLISKEDLDVSSTCRCELCWRHIWYHTCTVGTS